MKLLMLLSLLTVVTGQGVEDFGDLPLDDNSNENATAGVASSEVQGTFLPPRTTSTTTTTSTTITVAKTDDDVAVALIDALQELFRSEGIPFSLPWRIAD